MKLPVFPGVISENDNGRPVRLAQEFLCLHGFAVPVDGRFGPATAEGLRRFQRKSGLSETGDVDAKTFSELLRPVERALESIEPGARGVGQLIVAYAKQHLKENPREVGGENCGPWVRLYMDGSEGKDFPWCAGFACSIYQQACEVLGVAMPFKRSVSCDFLAVDAQWKGIFVSEKDRAKGAAVRPGSLFLCRNSPTDWTHTGLVVSTAADTFETIEGNTNDEGSREGYEVCRRIRAYKGKDFIVPNV